MLLGIFRNLWPVLGLSVGRVGGDVAGIHYCFHVGQFISTLDNFKLQGECFFKYQYLLAIY